MAGDEPDAAGETVALNGIDIYLERSGSGPRLLFLNGSGGTLDRMRPLLGAASARFDLVAHDQRGLGRTSIPPGPYTMADYAADAAAVLDHVGWDRARVMGISFGGMVAQELAVTWPERIERLALLCTSPGGAAPSYPLHELEDLPPDDRAAAYLPLLDQRFTPEWLAEHAGDRGLVEMLAERRVGRSDEQARGRASSSSPAATTTSPTASARSPAPRWWRAGATTASPRSPTARRSRPGCRAPSCGSTRAATRSSARTAPRCPRSSTSSAPADLGRQPGEAPDVGRVDP